MKRKGFTLIELIIAIGIIALLATVSIVAINPNKRIGQANDAQRNADLVAIARALEFYAGDNSALPADFASSNIGENHKVVLCSLAASLSCDGQTRDCLVVDDVDFLGEYLPNLPIDPSKTANTNTGYYITRASNNIISFGACESYQSMGIEIIVNIKLADYITTCGDGETEGDEVCDDGGVVESCGDGIKQDGLYCNSSCSGYDSLNETCDYTGSEFSSGCYTDPVDCKWNYCANNCTACVNSCI